MAKVIVKPGEQKSSDKSKSSQLTLVGSEDKSEQSLNEGQEKPLDENAENQYVWRCNCGFEQEKFGFIFTNHISEGKGKGEEHHFSLVDRDTGEVVANSQKEAKAKGLLYVKKGSSPKKGPSGGGGRGSTGISSGEAQKLPYQPGRALVEKFVQYTGELDGRLLLLYELTLPKYQAHGYTPTPEEWIEDVITQFYREHAADFKFDEVVNNYVEGRGHGN